MDNFLRLNLTKLMNTASIKNTKQITLKKGDIVKAKVINNNNGNITLKIGETEINSTGKRDLLVGQMLDFKVNSVEDNKILLEILKNKELPESAEVKKEDILNLKQEILSIAVKEKILLKDEKIENILSKYKDLIVKDGKIDKSAVKTLLFMEKNDLKFSEKMFKNIHSFINGKVEEEIDLKGDLKQKLKEIIELRKDGKSNYEKGERIFNSLLKKNDENAINLFIGIKEFENPAEIKIKYEKNDEDEENRGYYLNIKLNLEKLGELDININIWKKYVNVIFMSEEENFKILLENKNILKNNLENLGYNLEAIKVKAIISDSNIQVKKINITG